MEITTEQFFTVKYTILMAKSIIMDHISKIYGILGHPCNINIIEGGILENHNEDLLLIINNIQEQIDKIIATYKDKEKELKAIDKLIPYIHHK